MPWISFKFIFLFQIRAEAQPFSAIYFLATDNDFISRIQAKEQNSLCCIFQKGA
jgi:hypothetical protein